MVSTKNFLCMVRVGLELVEVGCHFGIECPQKGEEVSLI